MIPRPWLFATACAALLYVASLGTARLAPLDAKIAAEVAGVFPLEGYFHGEPLAHGEHVRKWGSHVDNDANTGEIALGPFPAPARLRFAVTGYPTKAGNEVSLQLARTGERRPISFVADIGERWNIVDADVPIEWIGQPIRLLARDHSDGIGGWLGLSEPLRGGRGAGLNSLRATFAAWAVNGVLLGLLWFAALRFVERHAWVAAPWQPLLAAGIVATLGYLAFWIYFASATAGKIFSWSLLLLALARTVTRRRRRPLSREITPVLRLMIGAGALYLALLELYPSSREFDNLAANRFRENMPGDNTIPANLAAILFAGQPLRAPGSEWLSSDRPPLQTGWLLLTWPVSRTLGFSDRLSAGATAVWFQLLWLPAAYGLLRALRLPIGRATAWSGVIALSGFFLQNTVFTWPKLSAAAFACGAFGVWILRGEKSTRASWCMGAGLAALGWLSHGGVAFAYLAMVPWLTWRALRGEARAVLGAAAVFLCFAVPWACYQHFYDPPGDMLIKLHLAGDGPVDSRSAWQVIRDAYRRTPWPEIVAHRRANFGTQVGGNWGSLFTFSATGASVRRETEFFFTARALTWWLLALPVAVVIIARHRSLRVGPPGGGALLAWTLLTVAFWCSLMFIGGQAVIHQGSYTVMIALFVLASAWLERAGRGWIFVVAALQLTTLLTTYAVANAPVHGAPVGLPIALLTGSVFLGMILAGVRADSAETSSPLA